jgi:hypothetical protein
MVYIFTSEDFRQAFGFALEYHLDPTKQQIGRTSAEPRGFGGVLDAFTRGKLVEIGVTQMIHGLNPSVKGELDFEMHVASAVRTDPDIISIKENNIKRSPNIFTEIKNTLPNDRYIGVTEEQLASIKTGAGCKPAFTIYASINVNNSNDNPRKADFVGMYLKHLTGHEMFDQFLDLSAFAKLEFVLSLEELERFGTRFPAGELFLETDMFSDAKKIYKKNGELVKGIQLISKFNDHDSHLDMPLKKDGELYAPYGDFYVKGSFNIYRKINNKSIIQYIHCITDVSVKNDVFGTYQLDKGNTYWFNLITVGRDPILKRNNLFIAKRRVYQLIDQGLLSNPSESLERIANDI